MVNQVSALKAHYTIGDFSDTSDAAITLEEVCGFNILQVSAWPDSLQQVSQCIAVSAQADSPPFANKAIAGQEAVILRIEPLKFWMIRQDSLPEVQGIDDHIGSLLDITHSRVWLRVSGGHAETLLNHFLPLDLRKDAFPVGTVASSAMHHVGVTLWNSTKGYNLFVPRGFAVSLWEMLCESAQQYGLEVR